MFGDGIKYICRLCWWFIIDVSDRQHVPMIKCTIGQRIFHKTFYDIGSGVNIMTKVTYEYLFGDKPLFPTYMQLQMADQSIWFPEGIAKDVMVRIHDHYAPADFIVLDMGEEEDDTLIILPQHY